MPVAPMGKGTQDELNAIRQMLSGGGRQRDAGRVYMGETPTNTVLPDSFISASRNNLVQRPNKRLPKAKGGANWMSPDEAALDFFKWSEKKRRDFLAQGVLAGILKQGDGTMQASALWREMVKEASMYGAADKKITPWDIMSSYVRQAGGANSWVRQGDFEVNTVTGERRYVGPRFRTTTDSTVDYTDPTTARAIATSLFQEMMGRNPEKGELAAFAKALGTAEAASPVVTTTTTEYNTTTGEPIGQNSTRAGGLTADARATIGQDQIKKDKEYGAFQAATTYTNALESAVYGAPE